MLLAGCGEDKTKPLQVSPETYRQMVDAFSTGVLALVAGDNKRAQAQLTQASQIVPKEPATWGNLTVLAIRNNDLDGAEQALQKAQSLAPPNSRLELLAGLIASRRGRPDEALNHFRQAVGLDGRNLIARYALVQELGRQPGPQSEAEAQQQLEQIAAVQPGNVVALLDLTRGAARSGRGDAVRRRVNQLQALSANWPREARQHLQELSRSASGSNLSELVSQIAVLQNVLKPAPAFHQSYDALHGPNDSPAQPIPQFIRLASPRPTPAPPDTGLTFTAEPLGSAKAAWARALTLAPAPPPETDRPPAPDGAPTFAVATGSSLILDTNPKTTLPLPGPAAAPEGLMLIDWNNDYRPDMVLAGATGVRLLQQSAPHRWMDVTAGSRLPAAITGGSYTGAWAVDIDLDGDLDIVLGSTTGPPRGLRNNADGTWAVIQPFPGVSGTRDLVWADLDGDGTGDVALIDGQGKLVVFTNERAGHYRRLPVPTDLGKVEALSVADVNRDGILDLVVLTSGGSIRRLSYRGLGAGPPPPSAKAGPGPAGSNSWDMAEIARWDGAPTDGSARLIWADLDNNGALDLIASGRGGSRIWLGGATGALIPLAAPLGARVLSVADLNGDGRLDLVGVSKTGSPVQLTNRGKESYHWQDLRPRNESKVIKSESGNQKINSFGVGGEAELWAGLLGEKQPITGPRLHFGLGDESTTNFVRLVWPNGQIQGEFDLNSDQAVMAKQRLTGSCPWLFADDGRGMHFVTDILWKSPLGLRINAQDTAGVSQTRDWVKVRDDQLRPRNGSYDLSITAELWETDYFDRVSLMTVDHPRGTEVLVDERFSIPQPALALHATGLPQPVTHAWDDSGRDVTDLVRARDGRYLADFGLGRYQGVTRDHYVEVELPESGIQAFRRSGVQGSPSEHPNPRTPEHLYLVASGWIYPTDSSINVAISQGHHDRPRGLSLEVRDARGRWVTARANLGFPAGKNKTILIDLTGVFPAGSPIPRRLRLRTNLEIYWDALAVATALPETPLRTREVLPEVADLRCRGFSTIRQDARSSPELPDYDQVAETGQQWLDLAGFYTRFGEVRELLTQVDDRYVIMNAGDEIRLRFPASPPPPAGWTRDFVFISDGWDKDGNFNTGFSATVLPLPSHDQPDYRRPAGRLEDGPFYQHHPRNWQHPPPPSLPPRPSRPALWQWMRG